MNGTEGKTIRVLIIDDHELVRAGLRMLVESRPGLEVVGEAGAANEALAHARREQPDIILLDLDLGGHDGLDLLADLRLAAASARVLIVTGSRDSAVHARAVRLSAMGIVQKEKSAELLLKAIEKVHEGEVWFDRTVIGSVLFEMTRGGGGDDEKDRSDDTIGALTPRELEIIEMLCRGIKNKEIALRLLIKESTVSHHLTNIFNKLRVSSRLELVIFAFSHSLAAPTNYREGDNGVAGHFATTAQVSG